MAFVHKNLPMYIRYIRFIGQIDTSNSSHGIDVESSIFVISHRYKFTVDTYSREKVEIDV